MAEPRLMSRGVEASAPGPAVTRSVEDRAIRILTFTTLYPNAIEPQHGIFVENRLRHLLKSGGVEAHVVAPVPWFPAKHRMFGRYAKSAKVPTREQRHAIVVDHPRYPVVPKIGMTVAPLLLYLAAKRHIERLVMEGVEFDIIDAHFFYPDGVAAAMLGRHFNKPVTITARGSDINLIAGFALPRRMIKWAATRAAALVTVSEALKEQLVGLGVPDDKVTTIYNGIDFEMFGVSERDKVRRDKKLAGTTLLSVGNLVPIKGHDIVLEALRQIPDVQLVIIGDGPEKRSLVELARRLDLTDRVRFLPSMAQSDLADWYSAADALVLASESEGVPNVILEAMGCCTPVVATDVGGVGEIVARPEAGILVSERSPAAVSAAIKTLLADPPRRAATQAYARRYDWRTTSAAQARIFCSIRGDISPSSVTAGDQ